MTLSDRAGVRCPVSPARSEPDASPLSPGVRLAPPVLHIFECWELDRRLPVPGDVAICGTVKRTAPTDGVPSAGNEHLACVVCLDLWGAR